MEGLRVERERDERKKEKSINSVALFVEDLECRAAANGSRCTNEDKGEVVKTWAEIVCYPNLTSR